MKKISALIMALAIIFTLSACSSDAEKDNVSSKAAQTESEKVEEKVESAHDVLSETESEAVISSEAEVESKKVESKQTVSKGTQNVTSKKKEDVASQAPVASQPVASKAEPEEKYEDEPLPTSHDGPTIEPNATMLRKIGAYFIEMLNAERQKLGEATLKSNSRLNTAAKTRSNDILTKFDHVRPNGASFTEALTQAGYNYKVATECIFDVTNYGDEEPRMENSFCGTEEDCKRIAEYFFRYLKKDAANYQTATDKDYTEYGVSISYKPNLIFNTVHFYCALVEGTSK